MDQVEGEYAMGTRQKESMVEGRDGRKAWWVEDGGEEYVAQPDPMGWEEIGEVVAGKWKGDNR